MNIDLVFNDIDGCFGDFKKPKAYPGRQSLDAHIEDLAKIRSIVQDHPTISFAACTGRSLYLAEDIIVAAGMNALSVVELGQVIHDPVTGTTYPLLEQVKPEITEIAQDLRKFLPHADKLPLSFPRANLKRMKDNKHMLTYEFTPKAQGGITGEELYQVLLPFIPEKIRKAIQKGSVKVVTSKDAIDIRMDIDKGHGIGHILKKLQRTGERCLGIGDSYHSGKVRICCMPPE